MYHTAPTWTVRLLGRGGVGTCRSSTTGFVSFVAGLRASSAGPRSHLRPYPRQTTTLPQTDPSCLQGDRKDTTKSDLDGSPDFEPYRWSHPRGVATRPDSDRDPLLVSVSLLSRPDFQTRSSTPSQSLWLRCGFHCGHGGPSQLAH